MTMPSLRLVHLTLVGPTVDPASTEFGPLLTIVHGPSDTGKSFIVDAIDFMLGAKKLKEVPERKGYETVLLGLDLANGERVTLSRPVNGGGVGLYESDVRQHPASPPDAILAAKHDADDQWNLSYFLLEATGLSGRRIRKNALGATDSLSFRNVAHLCVVDETEMQAPVAPPFTGSPVTRTKELSTFRLLLEGEDDASVSAEDSPKVAKAVRSARLEVVAQLANRLGADTTFTTTPSELQDQLGRLEAALNQAAASMEDYRTRRGELTRQLALAQRQVTQTRGRIGDLSALRARFSLLDGQYQSDLDRLDMLEEAGNLLGFFSPGVCPFCGAEPDDQHLNEECEADTTFFAESVLSERDKTAVLRDDLLSTLGDLESELQTEGLELAGLQAQAQEITAELREVEGALQPHAAELEDLLTARSSAEQTLRLMEQAEVLEGIQAELSAAKPAAGKAGPQPLDLGVLEDFAAEMTKCLQAWNVAEADTVRFDRSELDLVAGSQLRAAHGKGVRAILHAAFTIGLAQFCAERGLPHPGFVVLDSPLVTYRPPDLDEEGQNQAQTMVAEGFYSDIQERIQCQVLVMENIDPPAPVGAEATSIGFTKVAGYGRYGFFPHVS